MSFSEKIPPSEERKVVVLDKVDAYLASFTIGYRPGKKKKELFLAVLSLLQNRKEGDFAVAYYTFITYEKKIRGRWKTREEAELIAHFLNTFNQTFPGTEAIVVDLREVSNV